MKAYKVKDNKVIEVECEKIEYPLKDSEGDTIYENTHFKRGIRAYQHAISECEAGVILVTRTLKQLREEVREKETMLANECIDLDRLKTEFKNKFGQN